MSVFKIRKTNYVVYFNVGSYSVTVETYQTSFYKFIEKVKAHCVVVREEDEFLDWIHYYCYVDGEPVEIARIENYF